MAFTADDYRALIQLSQDDPNLRQQFAQAILADELARLPASIDRLVEEQAKSEGRLDRVAAALERLAEAQVRTETRLAQLTEAQAKTEAQIEQLTEKVGTLDDTVGGLRGRDLERRYQDHAMAYFGPLLRGLQPLSIQVLDREIEPQLTHEEFAEVLRLDLLLGGRPRHVSEPDEVWLAVEVSAVIDRSDVDRARQRAALLRQAGQMAVPVVAGESLTLGAEEQLTEHDVVLVRDGRTDYWEDALAAIGG